MRPLFLGIDVGTSGARATAIDEDGAAVATARAPLRPAPDGIADAEDWWGAVRAALGGLAAELEGRGERMAAIRAAAVDATSGSMVLVDDALAPVTPGLLYASAGFAAEAAMIAPHAPAGSASHGPASAPARMLRLQAMDGEGRAQALCHQADFVLARLRGRAGLSDEADALKLGHDPEARAWPGWFAAAGIRTALLPEVRPVGAEAGRVAPEVAAALGLDPALGLVMGATDSIAAFLATEADELGGAVTSLGTTLAVKLLSDRRIDDPARGIYSHRLGDLWLAGGASNTGGGVLLDHFAPAQIAALSARIDPERDTGLDYYPLSRPGERFPTADPDLSPRLAPRPRDDATFLQAMMEGVARIEREGYDALAALGAPAPARVLTAGGGAANPAWTRIRARILGLPVEPAPRSEAAHGMALLARRGWRGG